MREPAEALDDVVMLARVAHVLAKYSRHASPTSAAGTRTARRIGAADRGPRCAEGACRGRSARRDRGNDPDRSRCPRCSEWPPHRRAGRRPVIHDGCFEASDRGGPPGRAAPEASRPIRSGRRAPHPRGGRRIGQCTRRRTRGRRETRPRCAARRHPGFESRPRTRTTARPSVSPRSLDDDPRHDPTLPSPRSPVAVGAGRTSDRGEASSRDGSAQAAPASGSHPMTTCGGVGYPAVNRRCRAVRGIPGIVTRNAWLVRCGCR